MKSKVMDRPLFKGPAVPDDQVENVGIMQGFLDDEDDLEAMLGRDEDEEEYGDEDENNQAMERNPRTPEILMNNLRGDMRSIDARIEELADLVGYNAAMDTPEEVLMLLQPVLAKQGIGGLPAGGAEAPPMAPPAAPEMGGMPPEMGTPPAMPIAMEPAAPGAAGIESLMAPPAAPPMDQAPIQMRDGGYVQRFQDGSGEEGVTPISYPPELVKYAQEQLVNQRGAGNLKQAVADVMPVYRDILGGGDRRTMQGQALMDVAQAGLRLASGRNAQGANIAGGSFASQLASAAEGLPGKLAERAGQYQQEERAIKLAALKSAESNVEAQRKLFSQIVKSAGQSPFGKGDWDFAILNRPGLLQKWSDGKTSEEENNLIDSAITKMQAPRTEFKTDPVTKQVTTYTVTPTLPPFVAAALKRKGVSTARTTPTTTTTAPDKDVPLVDRPAITDPNDPLGRDEEQASKRERAGTPPASGPTVFKAVTASTYSKNDSTFFNMAEKGTGPISVSKPFLAKIPLLGGFVDADKEIEATTFLKTAINRVTAALGETERFGTVEKTQILGQLDLLPSLIDRKEAYWQRLVGLDTMLLKAANELTSTATNKELTPTTQGDARAKLDQIRQVRSLLGVPPRVSTKEDFNALEIGTPFVLPNGRIQIKSSNLPKGK